MSNTLSLDRPTTDERPDVGSWRRWRRRLTLLLLLALLTWLGLSALLLFTIHQRSFVDQAAQADVIVVLGSGLQRGGRPGPALTRRTFHGADLYHAGHAERIICSGGQAPHQPRSEAEACAELLRSRGVPQAAIIREERSRSTEENALYTRETMRAEGWQRALVVSDPYHMFRSAYLFDRYEIDALFSPVDHQYLRQSVYTRSILREVLAFQWQIVKDTLNLPFTYVPLL